MDQFQNLVDVLKEAFGIYGLIAALLILLTVYIAKRAGLVMTSEQAVIANLVFGVVIQGLGDNPLAEGAMLALISSLLAALAHVVLEQIKPLRPLTQLKKSNGK
jgi:hypothetical protein